MNTETGTVAEDELTAEEADLVLHSYDGILEFDNPLPGWWTFLFWVFVIFAPIYYFYAQSDVEGRSVHDQYNSHMASMYELRFSEIGILTADRETIMKYVNDEPKWLAVGKVAYQTNCVSCHGANGEGVVGPNLTDEHWKHVRNVEDIARVIENGAANGAMPAWKTRLSHPNQIVLTAAYVAAMRDKPVAGKAPEGKKVEPWEK